MAFTRPVLRGYDLTDQQWRILRYAYVQSPIDLTSLSHATFIVLSNLSKICTDMEARDLIRKAAPSNGQRRVTVSITPRGKKLARAIMPRLKERNAVLRDSLSEREFSQLLALLLKLEKLSAPRK